MKYIRTKNGIFETISENDYSFVVKFEKGNWETLVLYKDKVIKESNNLEELCDCWDFFDSIYNEYKTKEICLYTLNNMKVSLERKYVRDVKLCIRTDKGLIYVAEMNDRGELELL